MSRNSLIFEITAALVALLLIGGSVVLEYIFLIQHGSVIELPAWLVGSDGSIIGFYFGRAIEKRFNGGNGK